MTISAINTEITHLTSIDIQNINAIIERFGRTYRAAALVRQYLAALEA